MNDEINETADQWFDSTFLVLNESYQLDLRRFLSTDTCELIHILSDFYMYDYTALFIHLLGLTSHYLTSTSFVYADNQLRHKLNLHLLLVAREGYERSSLVEHIKQSMNNAQSIRQIGKPFDIRHPLKSNIFCRSDDLRQSSFSFCISDKFDEHGTPTHIQQQQSSSILGTSNGSFVRQLLETQFNNKNTDWLMIFIASKGRLFCRRSKIFDLNRYPSLEHWVIIINCLCSNSFDFYFDQTQANQLMCDYLDALSLKAISVEDDHPSMASRYLSAREHVLRVSASLRIIEMAIETLVVYRQTFHTFGQADKIFFDNSIRIIEQRKGTTITTRVYINSAIVKSAIYFVDISIKQFEIMFEPTLSTETPQLDLLSTGDHRRLIQSSSSFSLQSQSSTKRMKTMMNLSHIRFSQLAYAVLLFPFVAFTRTSLYINSKIKRYASHLNFVIKELKNHHLIRIMRQGVQMIDGTRRRVDLLIKSAPVLKENELYDKDLKERLNRFNVDYNGYIQTLGTIDIGEKYRLSDQCFILLNSSDYKRYLTIDLEHLAPIHRIQQQEEGTNDSSPSIKLEPTEFYI